MEDIIASFKAAVNVKPAERLKIMMQEKEF